MNTKDLAKLADLEGRLAKLQKRAAEVQTAVALKSKRAAVRALTTPEGAGPAMSKGEYARLRKRLIVDDGAPTPAKPAGGSGERGTLTERMGR